MGNRRHAAIVWLVRGTARRAPTGSGYPVRRKIVQVSTDSTFFDFTFKAHGFPALVALAGPDKCPWPREHFCCPGTLIIRIIMLSETPLQVVGVPAVKTPGCLALKNVDPVHVSNKKGSKRRSCCLVNFGSPARTRIPLIAGWLIPPLAGLCRRKIVQVSTDSTFFDFTFKAHGFPALIELAGPDKSPWSREHFCCPGTLIIRIIVLSETPLQVVGVPAVKPP
jgi:hypothetical protein